MTADRQVLADIFPGRATPRKAPRRQREECIECGKKYWESASGASEPGLYCSDECQDAFFDDEEEVPR